MIYFQHIAYKKFFKHLSILQFEFGILEASLFCVQLGFDSQFGYAMSNPTRVSRIISKIVSLPLESFEHNSRSSLSNSAFDNYMFKHKNSMFRFFLRKNQLFKVSLNRFKNDISLSKLYMLKHFPSSTPNTYIDLKVNQEKIKKYTTLHFLINHWLNVAKKDTRILVCSSPTRTRIAL